MALSVDPSDIDFWDDKIDDGQGYTLEGKSVNNKELREVVNTLAEEFPGFQAFLKKYFPTSRSETANKRRELLKRLKKANGKETKEEKPSTKARFQ